MSVRILDIPQGSPAWHAARRRRYGASELPKLAGLCPYGGPVDVWRGKRGVRVPKSGNALHMRVGHALEGLARELWTEETGASAEPGPVIAEVDGWLLASLDHWSADREPIDAKVRFRGGPDWHLWSESTIPEDVALQLVQQALLVEQLTGRHLDAAHVAALIGDAFGLRFMAARLPLTCERRELHAELAATVPAWHAAYVLGDAIPEDAAWQDVAATVDTVAVTTREPTEAEAALIAQWAAAEAALTEANRAANAAKAARDEVKNELARSLGPKETVPGVRWAPHRAHGPQLKLTNPKE